MEKVNIGIIGHGRIAQDQTASAVQLKNTRVAAVCDKNKEAAEAFAKKFGIPKVYTEYEKMLSDPEIQAVYNCTPKFLHAKVAIDAARAKKHVLTQKPFANTLEEAMKKKRPRQIKSFCRQHFSSGSEGIALE